MGRIPRNDNGGQSSHGLLGLFVSPGCDPRISRMLGKHRTTGLHALPASGFKRFSVCGGVHEPHHECRNKRTSLWSWAPPFACLSIASWHGTQTTRPVQQVCLPVEPPGQPGVIVLLSPLSVVKLGTHIFFLLSHFIYYLFTLEIGFYVA